MSALLEIDLPDLQRVRSGKVREVFAVGERLLIVSSDRISAFDQVMREPVPGKGQVLNQLSAFWFRRLSKIPNHFITARVEDFPPELQKYAELLHGRSMLVRKAVPFAAECVVRGYLAGSAWTEYRRTGTVNGIPLVAGLVQAAQLPEPLFTPSTKAQAGHDTPLSWAEFTSLLGPERAEQMRALSLSIYQKGAAYAARQGIIIADTKFEFGELAGRLLLIDECLTPDSSRFWPVAAYATGGSPLSFDKQFVRDYLESTGWDKQGPPPSLPPDIIMRTAEKYQEALVRLVG